MSTGARAPLPDPRTHEGGPELVTVRLLGAPLRLWDRASVHTAELLREFALLTVGLQHGGHPVPRRLLELVAELTVRYAGLSDQPETQRLEALADGRTALDLVYQVPPDVGGPCTTLMELLDEADEYCERGTSLITLAAPADQQQFRRWYLGEFVRQLDGHPPTPWPGPVA